MRRVAFAILSTAAGLVGLLSFKTEATGSASTSTAAVGTPHAGTSTKTPTAKTPTAKTPTTKTGAAKTSTTKTVTGGVAETQYGPVQVRITVRDGTVISATAIEYPTQDPRDAQINEYAIPVLQRETVGKTSANQVDMVSGATYTSQGYLQSLQSALDKAGL